MEENKYLKRLSNEEFIISKQNDTLWKYTYKDFQGNFFKPKNEVTKRSGMLRLQLGLLVSSDI